MHIILFQIMQYWLSYLQFTMPEVVSAIKTNQPFFEPHISAKFFIPFCLSYLCSSIAQNFVLKGAVLTELFMIYYASRALAIKISYLEFHKLLQVYIK